jgi:hypothetical protein
LLIVDRPNNAESVWVCLDKGEGSAPSEIIVLFQTNGIYKYEYNITIFKISPDEEEEVIKYIIDTLKANIVGVDATSGGGKALLCSLAKIHNKTNEEHIFGVSFNEKIAIDFEKDTNGNLIYDNKGKAQYKQEFVIDWSIQRLKSLFYNKKIRCLYDTKLDQQFDGIIVMKSGQRTVYGSKVANHLHQAWQVFSILQWQLEFKTTKPIQTTKPGVGSFGD